MKNLKEKFYKEIYGEEKVITIKDKQLCELKEKVSFLNHTFSTFENMKNNLLLKEILNSKETNKEYINSYKTISSLSMSNMENVITRAYLDSIGTIFSLDTDCFPKMLTIIKSQLCTIIDLLNTSNDTFNIRKNLFNLNFSFGTLWLLISCTKSYCNKNNLKTQFKMLNIGIQMFFEKSSELLELYLKYEKEVGVNGR